MAQQWRELDHILCHDHILWRRRVTSEPCPPFCILVIDKESDLNHKALCDLLGFSTPGHGDANTNTDLSALEVTAFEAKGQSLAMKLLAHLYKASELRAEALCWCTCRVLLNLITCLAQVFHPRISEYEKAM